MAEALPVFQRFERLGELGVLFGVDHAVELVDAPQFLGEKRLELRPDVRFRFPELLFVVRNALLLGGAVTSGPAAYS